jgi:hypothetical protein
MGSAICTSIRENHLVLHRCALRHHGFVEVSPTDRDAVSITQPFVTRAPRSS